MDFFLEGLLDAIVLIFTLDHEVISIAWTSLKVSIVAVLMAAMMGLPLGFIIATKRFPFRRGLCILCNALMALPTVVVGLLVYGLLSREGPFGVLGLLYTPYAMIMGQGILSLPILVALSISAISSLDERVKPTALTLGATPFQAAITLMKEARYALAAAVAAGFARVITEVGSAIMVGGNIRGYTRTLTTAIALETAKGEFALSMALGIILIIIALGMNLVINTLQSRWH